MTMHGQNHIKAMSCLSIRMKNSDSTGGIFVKYDISEIFRKSGEKFQFD